MRNTVSVKMWLDETAFLCVISSASACRSNVPKRTSLPSRYSLKLGVTRISM